MKAPLHVTTSSGSSPENPAPGIDAISRRRRGPVWRQTKMPIMRASRIKVIRSTAGATPRQPPGARPWIGRTLPVRPDWRTPRKLQRTSFHRFALFSSSSSFHFHLRLSGARFINVQGTLPSLMAPPLPPTQRLGQRHILPALLTQKTLQITKLTAICRCVAFGFGPKFHLLFFATTLRRWARIGSVIESRCSPPMPSLLNDLPMEDGVHPTAS